MRLAIVTAERAWNNSPNTFFGFAYAVGMFGGCFSSLVSGQELRREKTAFAWVYCSRERLGDSYPTRQCRVDLFALIMKQQFVLLLVFIKV